MADELHLVTELRPQVAAPDPVLLTRERDALMTFIADGPAVHRPRRWLLAAAILLTALVGAAAGGWALTRGTEETTEVGCALDRNLDSIAVIDASSGDPVADCAAEWRRRHGSAAPPLVAYDNAHGGVQVVPKGLSVPSEWRLLPEGFRQDARLVELDAALGDLGSGLNASCLTLPAARALAVAELARLRLDSWSVASERGRADGARTCTQHYLDRERRRVVLIPLPGAPRPDAPYAILARRLAAATKSDCLTVESALTRARAEASALGLDKPAGATVFHVVYGTGCARVTVNVGGRVEVTIRGKR